MKLAAGSGAFRIDGAAQIADVFRIEQSRERDLDEVRIAEPSGAVAEVTAQRLGDVMHGGGRSGSGLLVTSAIQHAHRL